MATYQGPLSLSPSKIPLNFGKVNVNDNPFFGFWQRITAFEGVELVGGGASLGPFYFPGRMIKSYSVQIQQDSPPAGADTIQIQPRYAYQDGSPFTINDWGSVILGTVTHYQILCPEVHRPTILYLQSVNKSGSHTFKLKYFTVMAELL